MTINEIIIEIMKNTTNEEGKPIRSVDLIDRMEKQFGVSVTPAAFSDRLKNKSMKTSNAIEILEVMGYELVARPKKGTREEYVLERGWREKEKKSKGESEE